MTKIYSFNGLNRALSQLVRPSRAAPGFKQAPMQDQPKQSITTLPYEREVIDFSQAGPVLDLVSKLHWLETVQSIPVKQPGYILRAAHTPVAANTEGIPDQRLGQMSYPEDRARASYVLGAMSAPARLQSVPGYVVKQVQVTKSSPGYPSQALKAPRPNSGGGQCQDG
jgi:hypothetical protein